MNKYGVVGGTLWGNRGAEEMVVTTIGRVRERDPGAAFVLLSYFPDRDRELLRDEDVTVVDARPRPPRRRTAARRGPPRAGAGAARLPCVVRRFGHLVP